MSKLSRALRSLFRVAAAPAADRALEERLLARYDALHPDPPRSLPMRLPTRLAVTTCATLALGLVAFQAPAQIAVSLGRSVAVTLPQDAAPPDAEGLAAFFQRVCHLAGETGTCEVGVRMQRSSVGPTTIHFDVWCEGLPASLGDAMRTEFPELEAAEITEQVLEGRVDTSLAGRIGHDLLGVGVDLDQDDEAALRRAILESLGARVDARNVEVEVRGNGDDRQVLVKVTESAVDHHLVLDCGESKTLPLAFPIGRTWSSSPEVLAATIDAAAQTITFTGLTPGTVNFVIADPSDAHEVEYQIVVEPAP